MIQSNKTQYNVVDYDTIYIKKKKRNMTQYNIV